MGWGSKAGDSRRGRSCDAAVGSHASFVSHVLGVEEEEDASVRRLTRWRRMGERRGRRAGGGRGDAKAVGRQASRGGRSVEGEGGEISRLVIVEMLGGWRFGGCR